MSHNYLFDTYRYMRQRLDQIKPQLTGEDAGPTDRSYAAGQIEALCDLERFIKERYDVKLPRRLRNPKSPLEGFCTKIT